MEKVEKLRFSNVRCKLICTSCGVGEEERDGRKGRGERRKEGRDEGEGESGMREEGGRGRRLLLSLQKSRHFGNLWYLVGCCFLSLCLSWPSGLNYENKSRS